MADHMVDLMSNYALRVPDSLLNAARRLAETDNTSLNQFFVTAIAEKVSAMETATLFTQRGTNADVDAYLAILAQAPDAAPVAGDDLA
jgi:hypothetical protein